MTDSFALNRERDTADDRSASAVATDAERAATLLKADIVSGALSPDSKLKIRELRARYNLGASPLREALAQLAAQGFVLQASQRGFRVAPLSADHLDDITRSRQLIEGEALRLAMRHGTATWEAGIVSSLHLLERELDRLAKRKRPFDAAYEHAHAAFHEALIAGCPLPTLKTYSKLLYVQGSRYRRLMYDALETKDRIADIHRALARLVLARKVTPAVSALVEHIEIPARLLLERLRAQPDIKQSTTKKPKRRTP